MHLIAASDHGFWENYLAAIPAFLVFQVLLQPFLLPVSFFRRTPALVSAEAVGMKMATFPER